jgi:hypothetical protein
VIDPNLAAEVESCRDLYLRELRQLKDSSVVVILDEAIESGPRNHTEGSVTFHNVRDLEVTRNSRAFELTWNYYVAYSVQNEEFSLPSEGEEIASGRLLRVYRKSHFLDYLSKTTWGDAERRDCVIQLGSFVSII